MQYVGAVVGAVIGFYVGGPSGAFYGAEIGYTIGSVIAASNSKIVTEGPRLSDLKVTISSNGAFIYRVYVYAGGVGGNIIDGTDLVPTTTDVTQPDSGGKGGPEQVTRETTYSSSFLVLLCKSLGTHSVQWIKANGNLIYSRTPDADALAQISTNALVGSIIVYDGNGDQLPDPTLEAIHGVGNVPGYRGRLSVMFKDFQLAKFSNNVAATQLTFGIVENPVKASTEQELFRLTYGYQSMLDKSGIWLFRSLPSDTFQAPQVYLDALDGSGPILQGRYLPSAATIPRLDIVKYQYTFDGCPPPEYALRLLNDYSFGGEAVTTGPATVWRIDSGYHMTYEPYTVYDPTEGTVECTGFLQGLVDDGDIQVDFFSPLGVVLGAMQVPGLQPFRASFPPYVDGHPVEANDVLHGGGRDGTGDGFKNSHISATDGMVFAWCEIASQATQTTDGLGHVTTTPKSASWLSITGSVGTTEVNVNSGSGAFTYPTERVCGLLVENGLVYVVTQSMYDQALGFNYALRVIDPVAPAETQVKTYAGGRWLHGGNATLRLFLVGGKLSVISGGVVMSWADDGSYTPGDLTLTGGVRNLLYQPDFSITALQDLLNGGTGEHQERVIVDSMSVAGSPQPVRLAITKLHQEVGLENYQFASLPDSVLNPGYVVTRQASARVAIDYLRDLFRIDTAEQGDKIKYVLRGADPVRTLTVDELGAVEGETSGSPPQAVEWTLPDEYHQPRAVNLKYTASDANFEVGTAIARRETTPSQEVVTLDATAMMLTGTMAARLAEQAIVDHSIAGETSKICVTYQHEDLETSDPIIVPGKFKNRRVRVTSKTDKGGIVELGLMRDEPTNLQQFVVGGSATSFGNQSTVFISPVAYADFLNLPSLRPVDNDGGGYVFVWSGRPKDAKGAAAYDQAATSPRAIGSIKGAGGVRGFTTTVLGDFAGAGYDSGNFVDVQFPADTALESTTPGGMQLKGQCVYVIGGEIVGALTSTPLGGDVWRLSGGLLRGLRGTEAATGTHAAGEAVYWLTMSGLLRDSSAKTGPVSVAAVATGRTTADLKTYAKAATNNSQALVPFAPLYFVAAVSAGLTPVIFQWHRRSRRIQADPFHPAVVDDYGLLPGYDASQNFYALEFADEITFASPRAVYFLTAPIDPVTSSYTRTQRFVDYLKGFDVLSDFYARVKQQGQGTAFFGPPSNTVFVQNLPPLEFADPTSLVSFAAPDGTTSLPGLTFAGASHITSNRAVFAGGTDAITVGAFGAFAMGFGIGSFAFRILFKTAYGGEQTLFYCSDAAFSKGGVKLTMNAGQLSLFFGDYSAIFSGGAGASVPLMTSTFGVNLADGIEHIVDIVGHGGYLLATFDMRVDLVVVKGAGFKNQQGGQQVAAITFGNDPYNSGEGFVGTLGDLQAITNWQ